jgi:glycosyltransferase involved in cell wall biosynthesis
MTGSVSLREKADVLRACVIIPTYNNAATLAGVIEDVLLYCNQVIVVNDGSTDNTSDIVKSYPTVQFISYSKNVGKGWALRKAFNYAAEKGYKYAITIDSDGQHFAKDLPSFFDKVETFPGSIIIGARNMGQASVPGGSSFGNKFSNFWFRVETGIKSPDTQSGYRLYPLEPLNRLRFITRKYEFEIEVLVRAAWKGIKVESVPVTVYYAPKEERVSHFRPFKDFFRISILNTVLVLISFLYIRPRNFFRILFNKQKRRKLLDDHLFNPHHSAELKAFSVAFGVFMGIIPIWGFQLVAAIFLAILLKLNKPLVIVAANISIPPMIPLIIYGSYKMGALWMGANAMKIDFSRAITLNSIKNNMVQYIYGSITLAIVAGILFGLLTFIFLKLIGKRSMVITKAE